MLAGTPDLIAFGEQAVRVYDAKTGVRRDSHQLQVMIYMHCLKSMAPIYREKLIHGAVVYPDHQLDIPPTAIDAKFEDHLNYFLDILESADPAHKVPSEGECKFCDIPKSECPELMELHSDVAFGE